MQDYYKTSDTALASYLITEGFLLQSIDYSLPRYQFVFPRSKEILESAAKYISGNARTDPANFIRVNKKLLGILHKYIQWEDD